MALASMRSRFAATTLALSATISCSNEQYAGVDLRAGAAPVDVQQIAIRARSGDKHAQLALGDLLLEGNGVARDAKRAEKLYGAAALDSGGTRMSFVPHSNGSVTAVTVNQGPAVAGLAAAKMRLHPGGGEPARPSAVPQSASSASFQAAASSATNRGAFHLAWFEGRVPDFRGASRCEVGDGVTTHLCRPAARVRDEFKHVDVFYTSKPVATLDGELTCLEVICDADGGGRVVFEVAASDCVNTRLATLSHNHKYLLARVFCKTSSGIIQVTDYINQELSVVHKISPIQIVAIYKGMLK